MRGKLSIKDSNGDDFDTIWDIISGNDLLEDDSDVYTVNFRVYNNYDQDIVDPDTIVNFKIYISALKNSIRPTSWASKAMEVLATGDIIEILCIESSKLDGSNPSDSWTKINWDEPYSGEDFDEISPNAPYNYNTYSMRFDPSTGNFDEWFASLVKMFIVPYGE